MLFSWRWDLNTNIVDNAERIFTFLWHLKYTRLCAAAGNYILNSSEKKNEVLRPIHKGSMD